MYTINEHRLAGPSVTYDGTGNYTPDKYISPLYLVFHYTVLDYASTIRSFGPTGRRNASAHLVVSRSGDVTQMVDFNRRAWHAGTSSWDGRQDINTYSIGIEVENYGYLHQKPDGFVSDNNNNVDPSQVIMAKHKNPACTAKFWQQYTQDQLAVCEQLATTLASSYKLKDVVGHDDIAPSRKFDPGPAFPMERMRVAAFGRDEHIEEGKQYVVAVPRLNIRSGPGTSFAMAGLPLMQGTKLSQLQPGSDGWIKVAVLAPGGVRGWVYGSYLA